MATKNLRRRGRSWVVHYRRDGRQVWKSFADRDHGGERAAREAAELALAQARIRRIRAQPEPVSRSKRLDVFAAEWLEHTRARVGAQTAVNYESVVRVHVVPSLGHLELRQVTRRALDQFVSDWAAAGPLFQERVQAARARELERAREQKRTPRPVRMGRSAKTIGNAIVVLSSMLGQAVAWGMLEANPAARLQRPRDEREAGETMMPLDAEGIRALVAAADTEFGRTLLLTAAMTGARRGELLGLRWSDVDWNAGRVRVSRSIGLSGAVKKPKSRKSVRAIALTPTLASELRRHRMASPFSDDSDYVFPSERGTPLDGGNMVKNVFEPARRRAKLPRVRFHDLRHSFASLLIAQNAHPKYISEQLGHASVQITLDRYGHLLDQSYTDESAKLEAALFGDRPASALQAFGVRESATAFHLGEAAGAAIPAAKPV